MFWEGGLGVVCFCFGLVLGFFLFCFVFCFLLLFTLVYKDVSYPDTAGVK